MEETSAEGKRKKKGMSTEGGAAGTGEADVVNPIVFFDITLGGEFFPFFTPFLYIIPP